MSNNLIPPSDAKVISSLGSWHDGDQYPLGKGRIAEFDGDRRVFIVKERGNVLGEVSYRAVRDSASEAA